MLHELLLALSGHQGQVFASWGENKIKVNEALGLFHPCELSLLNELLCLASELREIQTFIAQRRDQSSSRKSDGEDLHGLYAEALCEGLEQVLLPYRTALIDLERRILEDGRIQLSHIQHELSPYQILLPSLTKLIRQLALRKAHGCYILDVVYKASCSGVEQVQEAMNTLLYHGHKVLYKQLLAWMLQGSLFDPYEEFFIVLDAGSALRPPGLGNLCEEAGQFHSKAKKHRLKAEMVPGHISMKLAEKIFFIGESIQLFETDRKLEVQGSVLRERETEVYERLAALRDLREFRVVEFERFVDSVRETASRHLHSLLLERADLKAELWIARNFFLLGRGELFHTFITKADPYLEQSPGPTTQHDVRQTFLSACRGILQDDEKITKKIKMLVINPKLDESKVKPIGWKCVALQYSVPWPLHLILTEASLAGYNRVFQFLITVKRAQLQLHNMWALQKWRKAESYSFVSQLRTHMTFVVDNLQQYFMADVLETQFTILTKKLDNSTNFEELRQAHDLFLNAITTQTFLENKPVSQCLSELLAVCLQFCRAMESNQEESFSSSKAVSGLALIFSRQSGLLFQLLSSLRNHHSGSHLTQLLLRIDFNRYFSTHGHDVGSIA